MRAGLLDGLTRVRQWLEHALQALAQRLEARRQREALAEVRRVLVDGEARTDRRDLEQHAARLAEVDRAEVEAVDDGRRAWPPGLGDARLPRLLVVGLRRERDVVHRACARRRRVLWRCVICVEAAALLAAHLPALAVVA